MIDIDKVLGIIVDKIEADSKVSKSKLPTKLENQLQFYRYGMKGELPSEWKKFLPKEPKRDNKHPLQFEYCECGCHCFVASSKGMTYSIFMTIVEGEESKYLLSRGHRSYGGQIIFFTYEEAIKAAQDNFDQIP